MEWGCGALVFALHGVKVIATMYSELFCFCFSVTSIQTWFSLFCFQSLACLNRITVFLRSLQKVSAIYIVLLCLSICTCSSTTEGGMWSSFVFRLMFLQTFVTVVDSSCDVSEVGCTSFMWLGGIIVKGSVFLFALPPPPPPLELELQFWYTVTRDIGRWCRGWDFASAVEYLWH
jgi:hypothetical protein